MNILFVSHFYPPHHGGVEMVTYFLAKTLAQKMGHHVVVLTSNVNPPVKKYEYFEGVHVYRFKPINPIGFLGKKIAQMSNFGIAIGAILTLPKIIKKHKIQLIHLQSHIFPIVLISWIFNYLVFRRKSVLNIHGRIQNKFLESFFDNTITRRVYTKFGRFIASSKSLKNRLVGLGVKPDLISMCYNGIDFDLFEIHNEEHYLRNKFRIPIDEKIVLFIGRLEPVKGVEFLLRAIPYIVSNYPKVKFVIWGSGPLKNELLILVNSLKIQNYVFFGDFIEKWDDMPKIYHDADVFCLPSLTEGFPMTVIEALASGLPVIASETEGIPDAIEEGVNGFLVPPKDVSAIGTKILQVLKLDPNEVHQYNLRNRQKAKNVYSWEVIAKNMVNIYRTKDVS